MPEGVIDERFPEAIANYAGAMAAHFKGLVNHYSPHNEPGLNCLFCGLVGRWPPYQKSIESWAKIGVRVAKGMVLEMEAIRQTLPDAVIVSVDPFFYGVVDPHLPPAPSDDAARRHLLRAAAFYPASLAYGKVTADHPFGRFLRSHGVGEAEVAWFQGRAQKPDIVGCNCYPGMRLPPAKDKPARSAEETVRELIAIVKQAVLDSHTYFDLPVYLTETSDGLTDEAKIAYINGLCRMVQDLRRDKVPIVGVNWWPLFDTIQWDYREKPEKPLVDFIYPGGWNNGLYKISPQADGELKRVPTAAVPAFQKVLRREMS
jgi:beta-glucosidase/6-phospho-beta-glucosidase/beta-galactosidase